MKQKIKNVFVGVRKKCSIIFHGVTFRRVYLFLKDNVHLMLDDELVVNSGMVLLDNSPELFQFSIKKSLPHFITKASPVIVASTQRLTTLINANCLIKASRIFDPVVNLVIQSVDVGLKVVSFFQPIIIWFTKPTEAEKAEAPYSFFLEDPLIAFTYKVSELNVFQRLLHRYTKFVYAVLPHFGSSPITSMQYWTPPKKISFIGRYWLHVKDYMNGSTLKLEVLVINGVKIVTRVSIDGMSQHPADAIFSYIMTFHPLIYVYCKKAGFDFKHIQRLIRRINRKPIN